MPASGMEVADSASDVSDMGVDGDADDVGGGAGSVGIEGSDGREAIECVRAIANGAYARAGVAGGRVISVGGGTVGNVVNRGGSVGGGVREGSAEGVADAEAAPAWAGEVVDDFGWGEEQGEEASGTVEAAGTGEEAGTSLGIDGRVSDGTTQVGGESDVSSLLSAVRCDVSMEQSLTEAAALPLGGLSSSPSLDTQARSPVGGPAAYDPRSPQARSGGGAPASALRSKWARSTACAS